MGNEMCRIANAYSFINKSCHRNELLSFSDTKELRLTLYFLTRMLGWLINDVLFRKGFVPD